MVDFPQIISTKVTVKAPKYAHSKEESFMGLPFSILQNSFVNLQFTFNKKVSIKGLDTSTDFVLDNSKPSKRINFNGKFKNSQPLSFSFIDEDGFKDSSQLYHLKTRSR